MHSILAALSNTGRWHWGGLWYYVESRSGHCVTLVLQETWLSFVADHRRDCVRQHRVSYSGTKFDSINWVSSFEQSWGILHTSYNQRFKWTVRVFGLILMATLGTANVVCCQHLRMPLYLTYVSQVTETTTSTRQRSWGTLQSQSIPQQSIYRLLHLRNYDTFRFLYRYDHCAYHIDS